jgi:hypothetical protein
MKCITAQLILWTITIITFLWLALSHRFDGLIVAVVVSSLVWYSIVPRTTSR